MATLLSDTELKKLIGSVILHGDQESIRPNSYVLRLGPDGEFINTGKGFQLGDKKRGIVVPPGHSVGVTAFETIDFRRETVHKLYPEHDLHGLISPTTDLSREGIVAPTTQVDAGYYGTLNWTLTNTSSEERRFVFQERLFRLTIFRLERGETPAHLYAGDYQSQTGYVRSRRLGPPVGMKEVEWEGPHIKGGPEDLLDNLIKSGYPWHVLGQRLKLIDQQFKAVSQEYSDIHDAIEKLTTEINQVQTRQNEVPETIRGILREETGSLQNRWLIGVGSLLIGGIGVLLSVTSNPTVLNFITGQGIRIGLMFIVVSGIALYLISRSR